MGDRDWALVALILVPIAIGLLAEWWRRKDDVR